MAFENWARIRARSGKAVKTVEKFDRNGSLRYHAVTGCRCHQTFLKQLSQFRNRIINWSALVTLWALFNKLDRLMRVVLQMTLFARAPQSAVPAASPWAPQTSLLANISCMRLSCLSSTYYLPPLIPNNHESIYWVDKQKARGGGKEGCASSKFLMSVVAGCS